MTASKKTKVKKADAPRNSRATEEPPDTVVGETDSNLSPSTQAEADTFSHGQVGFPIVGIGASAGGLAAFEAFFSGMPADVDPGMAFVLVQHLAPDHKSILTDLIRRYTRAGFRGHGRHEGSAQLRLHHTPQS